MSKDSEKESASQETCTKAPSVEEKEDQSPDSSQPGSTIYSVINADILGLTHKIPDMSTRISTFFEPLSMPTKIFPITTAAGIRLFDPENEARMREFSDELTALRRRLEDQTKAFHEAKVNAKEKEIRISELERTLSELKEKERVSFVLSRVRPDAQKMLLQNETFRKQFLDRKQCTAFVMAVDIRRSTELMLKARTPEAFAQFITDLSAELMQIVTDAYGVFDKFTGDGILAFFPDFYTGKDAAYYVIRACDQCHMAFDRLYRASRKSFSSVLKDVGLGIGIDFGEVHLVQVAGGLTVVGEPVVYACRLSGTSSGSTLLNQPAYEIVSEGFSSFCFVQETDIEIKHEGRMLAYDLRFNGRAHSPAIPAWPIKDNES